MKTPKPTRARSAPGYVQLARQWLPPAVRSLGNRILGRSILYRGEFESWAAASTACNGYDDATLLDTLEQAALAVRDGTATWEQDGVAHDVIPLDFPVLACVSHAALTQGGRLDVLDFGGGFGSSFYQCKAYLPQLASVQWHIVEQAEVVHRARAMGRVQDLYFYASVDECMKDHRVNVILLSSVLQYLPDPYAVLDVLASSPAEFIIIDRHPCSSVGEQITCPQIPAHFYGRRASYPSWVFDCAKFSNHLSQTHDLVFDWDGKDPPISGTGFKARFGGSFWRKRDRQ